MWIDENDKKQLLFSPSACSCRHEELSSDNTLLKLPGNSGCKVSIESYQGNLVVKKSAPSPSYYARLERQRIKQEICKPEISGVAIPKIIQHDSSSFMMEYMPMLDHVDFFERATPIMIQSRIGLIERFVEAEISTARWGYLEPQVVLCKLDEIEGRVPRGLWKDFYSITAKEIRENLVAAMEIPIGQCHGDLTLSNVLFSMDESKIALLDFLDSFVESPVVDLIKLRQDTRHLWTSMRYPSSHDKGKIHLVNRWIDSILTNKFADYLNLEAFRVLEIMNYLRIAPYVSTAKEHAYLRDVLGDVLGGGCHASNNTNSRSVYSISGAAPQMDAHSS